MDDAAFPPELYPVKMPYFPIPPRDVSLCISCGKQCEAYRDEPGAQNQCFECCPHNEGWEYDRGDRQHICKLCGIPRKCTAYED